MLTFEPFRIWFMRSGKSKMAMQAECGLQPTTAAKVWNDRFPVRSDVIEKICRTYNLRIEQVIEYRSEVESIESK